MFSFRNTVSVAEYAIQYIFAFRNMRNTLKETLKNALNKNVLVDLNYKHGVNASVMFQ